MDVDDDFPDAASIHRASRVSEMRCKAYFFSRKWPLTASDPLRHKRQADTNNTANMYVHRKRFKSMDRVSERYESARMWARKEIMPSHFR